MSQRMFDPPEEEPERRQGPPSQREEARFVEQMMYLLTAPHLSWPGWEDTLQRHKEEITMRRLAHHREIFDQEMCTEFEAMLYVSTVSLAQPISRDWFEIYMWLFRCWNPEAAQDIDPHAREELNLSQVDQLNRLRRWIYRTQMNHLKARQRTADRKEVEDEQKQLDALQPRMFELPEEGE